MRKLKMTAELEETRPEYGEDPTTDKRPRKKPIGYKSRDTIRARRPKDGRKETRKT